MSSVQSGSPRPAVSLSDAEVAFRQAYPAYATTHHLDELRATEYARLDRASHVYLDYTGGGLFADAQVRAHSELLLGNVFGNPHSSNPTSAAMTALVEQARAAVREFFQASADEYAVIFTQNASGALKLVGESYPFAPGDQYLLTFDNHNSVNGIREFARARGATVTYAPVLPPDMYIDAERLAASLAQARPGGHNLFAYPAQSNFSGVQHDLAWIARAHACGWHVLLDAAAFAPNNRLDLSRWQPDFVTLSFYKIFGYPTGVGCLLARRDALALLHRPWFAGGTITVASVQGDRYYLHDGGEAFEDGTVNYLALPAVELGLRHIAGIGLKTLVHVYGPVTAARRGGTVTLNLYDPDGQFLDHTLVEARANQANISLRTGCFCNPGGGELALGISADELSACFVRYTERVTLNEFRRCIDAKSTGAVRVSVGLVTTFADVYRFVEFARGFLDLRAEELAGEA
jgi:selenocysteine lyase/cysteine desulfurase